MVHLRKLADDKADLSDPDRRVRVAQANNNGGLWWACLSKHTPAKLEHRFREGSVGGVLYKTVGGILGSPEMKHSNNRQWLYIQLSARDAFTDIALADIGIEPVAVIRADKITNP